MAQTGTSQPFLAMQERECTRLGGHQPLRLLPRIIAATHVDLAKAVEECRFREDLYYHLNVIPLHIPPLRERREDITPLARHFRAGYAQPPEGLKWISSPRRWPSLRRIHGPATSANSKISSSVWWCSIGAASYLWLSHEMPSAEKEKRMPSVGGVHPQVHRHRSRA